MNTEQWHQKIADAINQKVKEQDTFCAIIKELQAIDATAEHRQKLVTVGWTGLLKLMENECFPPVDDDWNRWLQIQRDDIPFNASLAKIVDTSIRGSTGILQGTSDQVLRQRALSKFLGIVGGYSPETYQVFTFWSQMSAVQMIKQQYVQSGMSCNQGLEILDATIEAFNTLGEDAADERLSDDVTGYQALRATTSLGTSA